MKEWSYFRNQSKKDAVLKSLYEIYEASKEKNTKKTFHGILKSNGINGDYAVMIRKALIQMGILRFDNYKIIWNKDKTEPNPLLIVGLSTYIAENKDELHVRTYKRGETPKATCVPYKMNTVTDKTSNIVITDNKGPEKPDVKTEHVNQVATDIRTSEGSEIRITISIPKDFGTNKITVSW